MTRNRWRLAAMIVLAVVTVAIVLMVSMMRQGFSAMGEPTAMEKIMAATMRHASVPAELRDRKNPVALTPAVLAEARAHFADHCASCHGNDGRGRTELGQHLYPKAPDMTLRSTQEQSDGELFATIENGVRLTGMPAWGEGTAESAYATWTLVHFIRHLPRISSAEIDEMKKFNPVSPAEMLEQKEEEEFLGGGDTPAAEAHHH